jgi:transcriptional regulator with XRE-family HTH domain
MSAVPRASQILLVGQKIRQIRKSRHLTQADLASRIGVTQSDLSRMENGEYKVGLDTLFRILQVFELSMSHFFDEEAAAEANGTVDAVDKADSEGHAGESPARLEVPFEDWAALSEESRREVREFIAFKRMQAGKTRVGGVGDNDGNDGGNGDGA